MKKWHVMHVVENLDCGGMENGVVNLGNLADRSRFRFSVCCLSHPGTLCRRLHDDVKVIPLGWKGGFDLGLYMALSSLFRKEKVDVVHTHGWLTLVYSAVASKIAGVPVLINGEHGDFHLGKRRRVLAYHAISRLVDRYVAVSYSLEAELAKLGICREKISTVPNGVDVEKFRPLPPQELAALRAGLQIPRDSVVIGSVGRLETVKNFPMLLRVFAELHRQRPHVRCLLVGGGSQRESLGKLARELGVEDAVMFSGAVDNPHQLTAVLDVFVSTSFSEGMSNTILEAMACGKPLVATAVGDTGKLVRDGENGLLIASGDSQGCLEALSRLLSDQDVAAAFGARSRAAAEGKFAITTMVRSYEEIYLRSLAGKVDSHGT